MSNIGLVFDRRFGWIHVKTDGPGQWTVVLADLIRQLNLGPEEWAMFKQIAEKPRETRDLEQMCREAIAGLDLEGKTVLDIGGYDGRMAAYALECGAARAICLDNQQWEHYGWTEQDKLPGVEYVTGDYMEWTEPVDVVIWYNVMYHVHNPWAALERLREITKETMLLCSMVRFDDQPRWYLYEPFECNPEDDTVYWGPSPSGLLRLLKLTGWQTEELGQAVERMVVKCW